MGRRELSENLDVPGWWSATVTAYRDSSDKSGWYIRFYMSGPDNRYNPGIAVVTGSKVPKLLEKMKRAYDKMKALEKEERSSRYSEEVVSTGEFSDYFSILISSDKAQFLFWGWQDVKMKIRVSSKTQVFGHIFNTEKVKEIIDKLSSAERLANNLLSQL